MYKHILIATDGSELAGKAVTTGLALAKQLKAKVTAVTATEPWTAMVTGEAAFAFPVEEYEKAAAENAARILAEVSAAAKKQDVAVRDRARERLPRGRHHRDGQGQGLRPHRHGLARPARPGQGPARQPGDAGADAEHGSGADLPLTRA